MQDQYDKDTLPQVWDELRRKVGDVQGQLPPGAGPSIVNDDFGDTFGVFLGLTGEGYSEAELWDVAKMPFTSCKLVRGLSTLGNAWCSGSSTPHSRLQRWLLIWRLQVNGQ